MHFLQITALPMLMEKDGDNLPDVILFLLNLSKKFFLTQIRSTLVGIPCAVEKNVCSIVLGFKC